MAQMSSLATAGSGPCKLYVKNLHPNITVSPADHATLPHCSQHVFVGSFTASCQLFRNYFSLQETICSPPADLLEVLLIAGARCAADL